MEKHVDLALKAAVILALFALFSISLYAKPCPDPTKGMVAVRGWVHVQDQTVEDVVLVVEVDGYGVLPAQISGSGRFTVHLPLGTEARLRFLKPGHLPKEVVVDTREMQQGGKPLRDPRKLKFDVVLEPDQRFGGRTYEGPVGSIAVTEEGVAVEHHLRLTPAQRHDAPDF